MLRLWRASVYSWNGLTFATRSEQAFREELVALALALPLSFVIGTTAIRRVELVAVVVLLIVVELLNTAIEKLANRRSRGHASDHRSGLVRGTRRAHRPAVR
ncbi:diacylglycerol kinase [Bradyrhizobium sp. WD16]|uniref:diacylglycerol kinase n=1 Tax=Bradyrhizobium sp. WD16 TaxID=1521768 RepID=UPI0020A38F57|nr:diacylglycerol kinase [Bradyrhizobium sp. WD16]UTD29701.1 diacylglycerol kinase [Bradyrhizobium sp. WD16]